MNTPTQTSIPVSMNTCKLKYAHAHSCKHTHTHGHWHTRAHTHTHTRYQLRAVHPRPPVASSGVSAASSDLRLRGSLKSYSEHPGTFTAHPGPIKDTISHSLTI